jgi:hypothetical protein
MGTVSDARMVFACRASRIYDAPIANVQEIPGVDGVAVSAMAAGGKVLAEKHMFVN